MRAGDETSETSRAGGRAILIDLDGVLRIWPATHRPEPGDVRPTVEHALGAIAFGPELLLPAITGRIDDPTWRREVERRLSIEWPSEAAGAVAAWSAMMPAVDHDVRELVQRWRRDVLVVLVTNATSRLATDLDALALGDAFDEIVNSSEVGAAKPDPVIFRTALARVGASADRSLLIDDTRANVEAAMALGLAGHWYDGDRDALRRAVSTWLATGDRPG